MTSPLQQKIKITGPVVVTANRVTDGAVDGIDHGPLVPFDQFPKCLRIAVAHAQHERDVGIAGSHHL